MKKATLRCTAISVGLFTLIAWITLSLAESPIPQAESPTTSQKPKITGLMPHGEVKDGLAAFLLCHSDRFKIGQPIPFSYGIANIGPRVETYDTIPPIRVCWFSTAPVASVSWLEVTGPDGKNIPYHGAVLAWRNFSTSVNANSVLLKHLQFVGNMSDQIRGFDMSKPGLYKVRWGYSPSWKGGPWTGKLVSNEIQIKIVK